MSKLENIKKYLSENEGKEKQVLIKDICEKFDVTKKSAEIYYYQWKKEFTGSDECIPKEEKTVVLEPKEEKIKEKIIIPHDIKPINTDEEEVFKKSKIKIVKADLKGEYGEYKITEEGVKVGEELFKNEDDLETYRKAQIRNFYLMLAEITEVLRMVKVR